jgi:hypothetical protein
MKKISLKSSATAATTGRSSSLASGIGALMTIIINTALLIWVVRLSAKHCGCVGGWRQEFTKYFAALTILIGVLRLANSRRDFGGISHNLPQFVIMVLGLLGMAYLIAVIINMYAVITYVDDINETKCECALKGMSGLNKSMIVLRWVYIAMLCLFGAMLLFGLFTYFQGRK